MTDAVYLERVESLAIVIERVHEMHLEKTAEV